MPVAVKQKRFIRRPLKVRRIRVLDKESHDPHKQLPTKEVVARVIALAQVLAEKRFYDYQIDVSSRVVESLLNHDASVISALMARQMGKTECVGATVAACMIIFPSLALQFPEDWKFNITDERAVYRGFKHGLRIGIYAPKLDQAEIMFARVHAYLNTDAAKSVIQELGLEFTEHNGNTLRLSNGSRTICQSASEQSKIEGETHHLLILEEAQDISDRKINKSLRPMVSSTMGTILMVGTASTKLCVFYTTSKQNEREELLTGVKNHFVFPYTVGKRFNSMYAAYVEREKTRLGEDSDEFRTSYGAEWIFERGMFVTSQALFDVEVAQTTGIFSERHPIGLPRKFANYSEVAGIDFGSSSDSTVVTMMAVDWNNPIESGEFYDFEGDHQFTLYRKHITDWLEFIGDDYEYQFWQIVEYLTRRPLLVKVVMDSNSCGLPMFHRFKNHFSGKALIEPFNFSPKVKSEGYRLMAADLSGHRVTFPAGMGARRTSQYRRFVQQMLDLRKDYKSGNMVVSHPNEKGAHDDYPDSWMLANWGAQTPAGGSRLDFYNENFLIRGGAF